jgi:thiamine pyrophosphokinase
MIQNRFLILSGGSINRDYLKRYLIHEEFGKIICADGGLEAAEALGLKVDFIVGDFDSVSKNILSKYQDEISKKNSNTVIKQYNPEKDVTDTDIAIELAIKKDAQEIIIFGATGSRVDHMMGNINLLMKALSKGIRAYIIDENNKIYLINQNTVLEKKQLHGFVVSLLPLTEVVKGICLTGFKYPLMNKELKIGTSLGISNELNEEQGFIKLEEGILIVIEARD